MDCQGESDNMNVLIFIADVLVFIALMMMLLSFLVALFVVW